MKKIFLILLGLIVILLGTAAVIPFIFKDDIKAAIDTQIKSKIVGGIGGLASDTTTVVDFYPEAIVERSVKGKWNVDRTAGKSGKCYPGRVPSLCTTAAHTR